MNSDTQGRATFINKIITDSFRNYYGPLFIDRTRFDAVVNIEFK